jgi:hypothetical protein
VASRLVLRSFPSLLLLLELEALIGDAHQGSIHQGSLTVG